MIFFPSKSEFLILPLTRDEIQRKLQQELTLSKNAQSQRFVGWIEGDKFQISMKLSRPNNYVPLMIGSIDSSSKDSIIFLKYQLMFSTKLFLGLWSIILLFLAFFFSLKFHEHLYALIAFVLGVINYLIVYYNFRKQLKISHDLFVQMMI